MTNRTCLPWAWRRLLPPPRLRCTSSTARSRHHPLTRFRPGLPFGRARSGCGSACWLRLTPPPVLRSRPYVSGGEILLVASWYTVLLRARFTHTKDISHDDTHPPPGGADAHERPREPSRVRSHLGAQPGELDGGDKRLELHILARHVGAAAGRSRCRTARSASGRVRPRDRADQWRVQVGEVGDVGSEDQVEAVRVGRPPRLAAGSEGTRPRRSDDGCHGRLF